MLLRNHIAYRFLTDESLADEIMETTYPEAYKASVNHPDLPVNEAIGEDTLAKMAATWQVISRKDQKAYYVTNTVLDKLDLLKVHRMKDQPQFDWRVFAHLKNGKYTFIMPPVKPYTGGICLRVMFSDTMILFCHLTFAFDSGSDNYGHSYWVFFWVDKGKNYQCEHFAHQDVQRIEEFVYKMLCFVFLSDNTEEILKPGQKTGTNKGGTKLINSFPVPLTIINSKWNITSIRTEGFSVSPHLALRWTGTGRAIPRMVLIDQFEKHGYIRRAKNEL